MSQVDILPEPSHRIGWGLAALVVAGNMISTMIIVILSILSVYMEEPFLVDVAIVYAMLSFITVVVLCRLVIVRRRVHEREEQEDGKR